jgi:hypothetical protein
VDIPRSSVDFEAVKESLMDLQTELAQRWPVSDIRLLRKNPLNLAHWEVTIAIGLATALLKPLGEKLRDEALKWLKRKFKRARKRRARTRRTRGNK